MCKFEFHKKVVKALEEGQAIALRLDVFPVRGKDTNLMSHMAKIIKNTFPEDRILFTDMEDKHTSCFIWLDLDEIEKLVEMAHNNKSLFKHTLYKKESEEDREEEAETEIEIDEEETEDKPIFH